MTLPHYCANLIKNDVMFRRVEYGRPQVNSATQLTELM